MVKLIVPKKIPFYNKLSIKDFYEKRNTILIVRDKGGIGDILMHRMVFEDIKALHPDLKIHFACPIRYHSLLQDHPYIDKLLDSGNVDYHDYVVHYDTSNICRITECSNTPNSSPHRSDIWAHQCGVNLTHHNMHLKLDKETIAAGKQIIASYNKDNLPSILISPISAIKSKDLSLDQTELVIDKLKKMGYFVYFCHTSPIQSDIPTLIGKNPLEWAGIVNAADYVVSVDSAAFHLAGGLRKPLVGIFAWADGKVYGKYYDFVLIQKHRDNGDWPCGPCYNFSLCPKSKAERKPCITEITSDMIMNGIEEMLKKWPI